MPKTYRAPEQEKHNGSKSKKTVGVYDQPERTGLNRTMVIVIAVIVALVLIFVLYRLSRGEEQPRNKNSAAMTFYSTRTPCFTAAAGQS